MSNFRSQSRARSTRRRLRQTGVAALVLGLLAAPFAAVADTVKLDGDFSTTSNSKNTHFSLCPGVGSSVDVVGTINYNGNDNRNGSGSGNRHFATDGTVTVTASVPDSAVDFLHPAGASVVTSNWDSNSASVDTTAMKLTVDPDWVTGLYKIDYTFSGLDSLGNVYSQTATNNVLIQEATSGCGGGGPANTAPTVNVTGFDDGDRVVKGSEPTPGCSVIDAEDTGESALPSVDRSALDSDGLGVVTVTCSYTDGGGLNGTDSASYTIYDASGPVITYVLSPATPDGSNGWYHGNVTLTWTVSEPDSPNSLVKTGCVDQNITADQASTSYSCSATSSGGSAGPTSVSIKRDGARPLVAYTSAAPSTADTIGDATDGTGLNDWWIVPVTATFTGTDALSGFDALATLTSTQTATSVGENVGPSGSVLVNSPSFTDWAGNTTAAAAASHSFNIDLTNPSLNVNGPANGSSFDVCNLPSSPTYSATDGASGVDSSGTGDSWTGPGGTGVGSWVYSAHATDFAGRTSTETRTYSANYGGAFSGVLQPINGGTTDNVLTDDNSRFKLGSTVPVKFRLACGTTPISGAVASLKVKKADGTPDPGTDEAISTAASTTGSLFRYDATAGQYIFNLSTKSGYTNPGGDTVAFSSGPGTYTLTIRLDDGSTHSFNIQLVR